MTLAVSTGREHRPVDGGDTTYFPMPQGYYVDVDGQPALAMVQFLRFVRDVAEATAVRLGEELHHADFWVTSSPEVVKEKGTWHDCSECDESMARVMAHRATNPDIEMVVGRLYWVAQ